VAKHPDVYADGFSITAGAYGVTLTLTRTQPTGEPGPHEEPTEIVARVRMSRDLGRTLSEALAQMVAAAAQARQVSSSTRH
jgi:hypothetical protein